MKSCCDDAPTPAFPNASSAPAAPIPTPHDACCASTPGAAAAPSSVSGLGSKGSMFRIAAILQGIAKRVEDGTASSAQARASGAGARPMAELAWGFAQKA